MTNPTPSQSAVTQGDGFWSRVRIGAWDECWLWTGGFGSTGNGYGRTYWNGRMRPATQVSWELHNGASFPTGKFACHSCDNTRCVNPLHIWPGTQSENLRDCVAKGRHPKKPKSLCRRGHAMDEANRKPMPGGGSRCRECERVNTKLRMRRLRERRSAEL